MMKYYFQTSFYLVIITIFLTCGKEQKTTEDERIGESLQAFQTFQKDLQTTLKNAVAKGGAHGAVSLCKIQSPQMEAKVSKGSISVKRVALKIRNPEHAPDAWERSVLYKWKAKIDQRQQITIATLETPEGNMRVMQPIFIKNGLCLQCHGNQQQIQPATKEILQRLYPQDTAVGYKMNELRGAFSAVWTKKVEAGKK
ncbi:MAG: DUF3365 domain-containing protein [Spirochaetota bacterium]